MLINLRAQRQLERLPDSVRNELGRGCSQDTGLSEQLADFVDYSVELRTAADLRRAGMRKIDLDLPENDCRSRAHDDDPVRKENRFFDIMRDEQDRPRIGRA